MTMTSGMVARLAAALLGIREPAQRAKARHEGVLAPARDHEPRQPREPPPNRASRHDELTAAICRAGDGIPGVVSTEEDAAVDPLRLYELELPAEVCAQEREHQPAILSVILHLPVGQRRPVDGPAPDHSMNPGDPGHRRVPRIRPPDVRAGRRLEAERIVVLVKEVISPPGVAAELGIVVHWAQRQRRAAPPAAHHLGGQQLLLLGAARALPEEAA